MRKKKEELRYETALLKIQNIQIHIYLLLLNTHNTNRKNSVALFFLYFIFTKKNKVYNLDFCYFSFS